MPRPKKERIVEQPPLYASFKPTGIRRSDLDNIALSLDEYEAIRLADYAQMDHEEAAAEMEISRSTFTRLLEKARAKVSAFLIEGRELSIEGGCVHFRANVFRCASCGHMFNIGIAKGLDSCPNCGSASLLDMAGGYGHGKCCRKFDRGDQEPGAVPRSEEKSE
jgi:uncharacterized protein